MPVITVVPQDITDYVLQGEEMRVSAIAAGVHWAPSPNAMTPVLSDTSEPSRSTAPVVVAGEQTYPPMAPDAAPPREVLRSPFAGSMVGSNAQISTPCGALYPLDIGNHLMTAFAQSSARWTLTGVTRDSTGAALGSCRVVVSETARIAVGQTPIVVETISDGSGNYSVAVPLNTLYQVVAYKTGSPDVAGVSLQTLTPAQV
jgi:hypothetical protein